MSASSRLFLVGTTTCSVCERGRRSVPALVEMRPGVVLCSECVRGAVEALATHYGDAARVLPVEPEPVPA